VKGCARLEWSIGGGSADGSGEGGNLKYAGGNVVGLTPVKAPSKCSHCVSCVTDMARDECLVVKVAVSAVARWSREEGMEAQMQEEKQESEEFSLTCAEVAAGQRSERSRQGFTATEDDIGLFSKGCQCMREQP